MSYHQVEPLRVGHITFLRRVPRPETNAMLHGDCQQHTGRAPHHRISVPTGRIPSIGLETNSFPPTSPTRPNLYRRTIIPHHRTIPNRRNWDSTKTSSSSPQPVTVTKWVVVPPPPCSFIAITILGLSTLLVAIATYVYRPRPYLPRVPTSDALANGVISDPVLSCMS